MSARQLIGAPEAATILGVHRATVLRWAEAGQLPVVEKMPGDNGPYLFDRIDVERVAAEVGVERRPA
ncbi:MAG: helix-turn-helix domain-containing protein [Nocardioidaceae bacterium]